MYRFFTRQNSCKFNQRFFYIEWDDLLALKKNLSYLIQASHKSHVHPKGKRLACYCYVIILSPLLLNLLLTYEQEEIATWEKVTFSTTEKNICSFHLFFWQTNDRCLHEQVMKDQSSILSQVHRLISREFSSNPYSQFHN